MVDGWDPWTDDPWKEREQVSLREATARFVNRKRREGRSPHTTRTYQMHQRGLRRVTGDVQLRVVKPSDVTAFISDTSVSAATRKSRYRHVRAFFRWCKKEGLLDESPLRMEEPKVRRELPKAISDDQLREIEAALREDFAVKAAKGQVKGRRLLWAIPAFWIALYTGLRRSELVRLRWDDVRDDSLFMREQKSGREEILPISPHAIRIIEEHPREHRYVIGLSEGRGGLGHRLSKIFRRYRREAGLPEHLSFHSLRHGFCTLLAENGFTAAEIKRLARHADITTSMRYVHLDDDHLKRRLRVIED